ncbi:hypothetical protein ACWM1N_02710 [Klebsiella grimontii]
MTTRHQVSLVTGVLILAIILPVILSIWLATQQAKEQFYSELDNFRVWSVTTVCHRWKSSARRHRVRVPVKR